MSEDAISFFSLPVEIQGVVAFLDRPSRFALALVCRHLSRFRCLFYRSLDFFVDCIVRNYDDLAIWAHSKGAVMPLLEGALRVIYDSGSVRLLELALEFLRCPSNDKYYPRRDVVHSCAVKGNLELLQYAAERIRTIDRSTFIDAVIEGAVKGAHKEIFLWIVAFARDHNLAPSFYNSYFRVMYFAGNAEFAAFVKPELMKRIPRLERSELVVALMNCSSHELFKSEFNIYLAAVPVEERNTFITMCLSKTVEQARLYHYYLSRNKAQYYSAIQNSLHLLSLIAHEAEAKQLQRDLIFAVTEASRSRAINGVILLFDDLGVETVIETAWENRANSRSLAAIYSHFQLTQFIHKFDLRPTAIDLKDVVYLLERGCSGKQITLSNCFLPLWQRQRRTDRS